MLNDYQEQIMVHPDISYVGSAPVSGSSDIFNTFVVKSNWSSFALREDAFDGIRGGVPLAALLDSSSRLAWVWPWDIVAFFQSVPGTFLSVLGSLPGAVLDFFSRMNNAGVTQDSVRVIAQNDTSTWQRFFAGLGSDEELRGLRPDLWAWCRAFAGMGPIPSNAAPIVRPSSAKERENLLEIITKFAVLTGLVVGALPMMLIFVVDMIEIAAAVAALLPAIAPVIAIVFAVFITLVVVGFIIAVIVAIVELVRLGLLIFNGSSLPASTVQLPTVGRKTG